MIKEEIHDFSAFPDTRLVPPSLQKGSGSLVQFDMEDMALWHQFITETSGTISKPWEREIPRLALSCDYLMVCQSETPYANILNISDTISIPIGQLFGYPLASLVKSS
jgi:hypothetical protein